MGLICRTSQSKKSSGVGCKWLAMTTQIEIRRDSPISAVSSMMISRLNAELTSIYPEEGANHFRLDAEEVADKAGAFLVAWHDEIPVGCGAVRRLDSDTAEIKRMYVDPTERGTGVGRALLSALEDEAKRLKVVRIVLETGVRQMQAMSLYETCGFRRVSAFGEYVGSEYSVCMEKRLT